MKLVFGPNPVNVAADALAQSHDGTKSCGYAVIILDHDFLVFIGARLACLSCDLASQLEAGFRNHAWVTFSYSAPLVSELNGGLGRSMA